MRARTWFGVMCAVGMIVPTARVAAQASQAELRGTTLVVGGGEAQQTVELGCTGTQVHVAGDTAFVACGDAGVALVTLGASPRVVVLPQPAAVQGLFAADGTLWARLADGSARPVATIPSAPEPEPLQPPRPSSSQLAPPMAPSSPPQPPAAEVEAPPAQYGAPRWGAGTWQPGGPAAWQIVRGRVAEVHRDRALVQFDAPIESSTVVEFVRRRSSHWGEDGSEDVVVARGIVETSGTARARVQLESNAAVESGLDVRTTSRRGGLFLMPPLPLGIAQIGFNYRMYLPLGTNLALGVAGDLTASYLVDLNGEIGLRFSANLTNLGGVVGPDPTPFGGLGHGYVSFAMPYFEVGIGLGASARNVGCWSNCGVGFSFAQLLRIGSEDGLSFRFASNVVIGRDPFREGDRWEFGDLYMDGRIPLGHSVWLLLRGGGGNSGLFYGDVGARVRLLGVGRHQSLFLSAGIGFGVVSVGSFSNAGPGINLGLEYRI